MRREDISKPIISIDNRIRLGVLIKGRVYKIASLLIWLFEHKVYYYMRKQILVRSLIFIPKYCLPSYFIPIEKCLTLLFHHRPSYALALQFSTVSSSSFVSSQITRFLLQILISLLVLSSSTLAWQLGYFLQCSFFLLHFCLFLAFLLTHITFPKSFHDLFFLHSLDLVFKHFPYLILFLPF